MNKIAFTALIALPLAACNSNTAPGNDREAQLDPACRCRADRGRGQCTGKC